VKARSGEVAGERGGDDLLLADRKPVFLQSFFDVDVCLLRDPALHSYCRSFPFCMFCPFLCSAFLYSYYFTKFWQIGGGFFA